MKQEFLLNAMADIDETYVREAEKAPTARKRKLSWKALVAAALIPLLTITAYAGDVLNIRTLVSGMTHYTSSQFSDMDKVMDKAGFEMDVKERFNNGFAFEKAYVEDTWGLDENDREVLKYREVQVNYRNADGVRLCLFANPDIEEITDSESPVAQTAQIGGVTVSYYRDHYKFVPANYALSEAEKQWEAIPGNYISYGTDAVEETDVAFACWEKDGLRYTIMDSGAKVSPQTLFAMAKELME
ncbi:MAG: hypothetical protein SPD95_05450 [Candidatus Faecousia sp.]|nr:hypothetical protein [Candidatus Faecousia sp.]